MAEITREEMQELLANQKTIMAQNEKLAQENAELKGLMNGESQGSTRILRRVTERKVTVRMVDGKVVLGYGNRGSDTRPVYIYEKPDPKDPTQRIQFVDLILEGAKEVSSVNFKEFRTESARVECKILKTDEKEWTINQGVVKKKEVEEYSSIELDFDVPLDVVGITRLYTVEIPREFGGPRNVVVQDRYCNIS